MRYKINTLQPYNLDCLNIGDILYITGVVVTARDEGHKRVIFDDKMPKFNLNGAVLYHAGPIVKKENNGYKVIACGPTTSNRMEKFEKEFIEKTKVKIIVGKGGMGEKTKQACYENKTIHCVYPGGCAVTAAESITEVIGVEWEDLGMPEALWIFKVLEFGPLIVSIDTKGNNLFENNIKEFQKKKIEVLKNIGKDIHKIFH